MVLAMLSGADPQPSADHGAAAATGVKGETGLTKDNEADRTAGTQLLDRSVAIMNFLGTRAKPACGRSR